MNACFYYYFEYHLHYGIKQSNWGIKIYFHHLFNERLVLGLSWQQVLNPL